jgi:hypothetical protein
VAALGRGVDQFRALEAVAAPTKDHSAHRPPRGGETSEKLGRHRWGIERSLAWLTGYRRLTLRYEPSARLFTAFLTLAAALTCYKKLAM